MPPEIMEAEMFPLFGGYWGYMNTPASKIQRHILRKQAIWLAEKEVGDDKDRREAFNNI